MSFDGHVLCQRMVIGPAWARATLGAAKPAAATAPPAATLPRNARRRTAGWAGVDFLDMLPPAVVGFRPKLLENARIAPLNPSARALPEVWRCRQGGFHVAAR